MIISSLWIDKFIGPPKRAPGAPAGAPTKAAPTKEEQLDILEAKVTLIFGTKYLLLKMKLGLHCCSV